MRLTGPATLALLLLLAAGHAVAWNSLTDDLDLDCLQAHELQIDCSYRLQTPEPPHSITARYDDRTLAIENKKPYPRDGAVTAAVLLVDTSDPARQPVIEKNREQIKRIVEQTGSYHNVGLASFDKSLRVHAPVGSSSDRIIKAAEKLKATGMTTELYRSTIKAIDLLAESEAERKVIFLFSDGQAEDKAYFHEDVIRAARENNVVINSLGFPRSLALSVALQTLRRLSEETGGTYIESGSDYSLTDSFLKKPFANIDRGGRFSVDISTLTSLRTDEVAINIDFVTGQGTINARVPVRLPFRPATRQADEPRPAISPTAPPVRIVTTPSTEEADELDKWLWYGVPFILLALVLLTVITLILLLRKTTPRQTARHFQQEEFKPYAYLIGQDEERTRYPITRATWRIGRSRDNEMTLDDNSVSRRHAELQRLASGKFMIYDHSSLNGVFVNSEKITRHKLQEGDIIEIGDFYLRFTEHPYDHQIEEDTVLQKTRAPSFE